MSVCPICGNATTVFAALPTPYLDRAERYKICTCTVCGHGVALGRQDPDYLASIYSDQFHLSSQQDTSNSDAPVHINARQRVQQLRVLGLSGRLLDVGAGKGAFVEAAGAAFEATGVELAQRAAEDARRHGLDVVGGDFLAADLPLGGFDVITLWDVLACFPDPRPPLERVAQLLRAGGTAVMTLPMIDSLMARLLRRAWPLAIPPVNLNYFSRRSIALVAKEAGLNVVSFTYPAKCVALNFILAKGARSIGAFGLAGILGARFPRWAIPVNTGDISCVILRRVP